MKKRIRRLVERLIEALLASSSAISSLTILLIVVFLFGEGLGLVGSPTIERGYGLYVHSTNSVGSLSPTQVKEVFDYEKTSWGELGGRDQEIVVFRFDEIFSRYSEEELGENYSLLPDKLAEVISSEPAIIAYLPQKYAPKNNAQVRQLPDEGISLWSLIAGKEWMPTATPSPLLGMLPLILGTLLVSIVAILIALPLGLGVAIYMAELASPAVKRVMKPSIELLAGIPSVVYGFFGLVVLVPLVQQTFELSVGETAFTGSLILSIMALPTIITVAEDALSSTPRMMREASLALGASQWQTIYRVVLPYSISGISAAVVLGIGRAIGETMAVLMVTGNAAVLPTSLMESVRTIPATIAAELGEAPSGGAHYQSLFILGCLLFLLTMVISVVAELMSKKQPSKSV